MTLWFCRSYQAILVVEESNFHEMKNLSADVVAMLPSSGDTVHSSVIRFEHLRQFELWIHLSMNAWTTLSDHHSYHGIVMNWCDIDYEIHNVFTALRPIQSQHSGANIANTAFEVIYKFEIGHKFRYVMLDGVTNSDTAVGVLQSLLVSKYGQEAEHTKSSE